MAVCAKLPLYPKDWMPVVASVEVPVAAPTAVTAATLFVVWLSMTETPAVPTLLMAATEPDVPMNEPAERPLVPSTVVAVTAVMNEPASKPPELNTVVAVTAVMNEPASKPPDSSTPMTVGVAVCKVTADDA